MLGLHMQVVIGRCRPPRTFSRVTRNNRNPSCGLRRPEASFCSTYTGKPWLLARRGTSTRYRPSCYSLFNPTMNKKAFPIRLFPDAVVRLLETTKYKDVNSTYRQRVSNLRCGYIKATRHFTQPHVKAGIKTKPQNL